MKIPLLFLFFSTVAAVAEEPAKPGSPDDLAAPLRKFDRNKDGRLADDELKAARQEHNRGGREAEPNQRRWREQLDRREKDFTQKRQREFDLNADGKLDDKERKELRAVWEKIAGKFTALRVTITAKYDRNDDGELNEQERNASRQESDRLRREIEDQDVKEWQEKNAAKPKA